MAGRLFSKCAAILLAGVASAAPAPQQQTNTASVNTTDNTPVTTAFTTQITPTPSSLGGPAATNFFSPAMLLKGSNLKPHLSQQQTNGKSQLGLLHAPRLPKWLNGPLPHGTPWGPATPGNTNPYMNPPNTGMTRSYTFHISEQTIAPDGVEKPGLVINGAFPGPTIEANWGDWIDVTVHNDLSTEGTTLHWHGLLQSATPWFDGVPAVQQCPIAPGSSFNYRFRADLYGTSWYHSHTSAQYAGGLVGAMIIYGPHNSDYDVDLGPIMLSDWYHTDYYTLVEQTMAPISAGLPPPISQNNLINGKMNYPCDAVTTPVSGFNCTPNAGISKFNVTSGLTYRLRLINSGAEGIQKFSIDGAKLTVIANDFVPIQPYDVDVVTLGVGQRSDVLFKATGKPTDAVWMRSTLGTSAFVGGCTLNDGISPEAVAAIYYQSANTSVVPTTVSTVPSSEIETCANDPLSSTVPSFKLTPPVKPHTEQIINITFQSNGTHDLFYMNNSTFRADYNDPVLLDAKLGHRTFPAEYNVYDFGASSSVRLIVYNYAQTGVHPMHLHGHNMYVLAVGTGLWDGDVVNANNPQRRDVQLLPNAVSATEPGHIVIQFDSSPSTASVWPFHCHIAWHVSAGLYINILEQPEAIKHDMQIPSIMAQTCRDWSAWTGKNVVPEIDSGL
ncbi:hypothetical protein LTR82_015646 [Friedmanniomyces endolithicus]|uniref:Multicopper oxidase n=1 Tax=Friedmanniomyces endolithicus TaxID=329885 RepID=A0AAN6FA78_9PEZI|nr:hypothetical protein LTR82_015646 [Friedmanniomyces endolithicus]